MKHLVPIALLLVFFIACNSNQTDNNSVAQATTAAKEELVKKGLSVDPIPKKIHQPKLSQEEMARMVKYQDSETGLFGYKNEKGEIITPAIYDQVMSYRESDLARVFRNKKFGFVNSTGKEVIKAEYDDAGIFSDGLAAVKVDGKWGYIGPTNKFIVEPTYDFTLKFTNGLSSVRKNNKWGYINTKGKEVIPIEYDATGFFSNGLANVKKGDKWGYVDGTNNVVIPFKYERTDPFSESQLQAGRVQLNKRFFYVNKSDKCVKNCPE